MARYTLHTAEGPKHKTLYSTTRQDVAAKLMKEMVDRAGGLFFDDENITGGRFLERWLSDCVHGSIRENTCNL